MKFKMKTCFTDFRFRIVIFQETTCTIIQIALAKMKGGMKIMSLKKRGMHCFRININSLLPRIHEVRSTANITNALIIGIGETKLDGTIWSSELAVLVL